MPGLLNLFRERVGRLVDHDTTEASFSQVVINDAVIEDTTKHTTRYRCSQRLGKGLFFTDEERRKNIARMRDIVLP